MRYLHKHTTGRNIYTTNSHNNELRFCLFQTKNRKIIINDVSSHEKWCPIASLMTFNANWEDSMSSSSVRLSQGFSVMTSAKWFNPASALQTNRKQQYMKKIKHLTADKLRSRHQLLNIGGAQCGYFAVEDLPPFITPDTPKGQNNTKIVLKRNAD